MLGLPQLRYSVRSLGRSPGLTATLLLSIALGVGSNATVAGFVRGLVTRDLPVPHPERLVALVGRDAQRGHAPLALETFDALVDEDHFDLLGAVRETRAQVVVDGRPSVRTVATVVGNTSELLGLSSNAGAVISHALWQQEFGGRQVSGMPIAIDGAATEIAAIAPEWLAGLHLGNPIDVWIRWADDTSRRENRASRTWWMLGRLPDGTSAFDVQRTINIQRSGDAGIAILPFTGMRPEAAGAMARTGTLLTAAALAVFVIAAVNVATFLLSRASGRSRETAVRVALGASRGQLASQLLTDALVLSVAGASAGGLFAFWTASVIPALFFAEDAEALVFAPDRTAIGLAIGACMTILAGCGLLPMLEVRHDDPAAVLRRESSGPSRTVQRLRSGFVIAQMACCCVLVIAAATLMAGFRSALHAAAGNRSGATVLVTLTSQGTTDRPDVGLPYFTAAMREANRMSGVRGSALVSHAPGSRASAQAVRFDAAATTFDRVTMDVAMFTPDLLDRFELPPVSGRFFGGADRPDGCKVIVVNEEAAETLFEGDAVGRRLIDPAGERVEIIGVVRLRQGKNAKPRRPSAFYYSGQTEPPRGQVGAGTFTVPVRQAAVRGILDTLVVSREYFELVGSPVADAGPSDDPDSPNRCRTGVINEEAAHLYFAGHAVGGAVIDAAGVRTEIVGVVQSPPLRAQARAPQPTLFLPITQDFARLPIAPQFKAMTTMIVRSTRSAEDLVVDLQRRLEWVEGGGAPPVVMTLEEQLIRTGLSGDRIALLLVGASAAIGLSLGIFGLYGAMNEAGRRRRREFAVRAALGARGSQMVRQILVDGLRLAGAGLVIGLIAAVPVKRWVGAITRDATLPPWVWIVTPAVLLLAVAIASVVPARRAAAVNPLSLMREE